jgi:hypothetical protein
MTAATERRAQLLDSDVRRLRQQPQDQRRLRLDPAGPAITPERTRPDIALLPLERTPAADAGGADPEPSCRCTVAGPGGYRGKDTRRKSMKSALAISADLPSNRQFESEPTPHGPPPTIQSDRLPL